MDTTPAPRDVVLLSQWLLDNHSDVYRDYHASRPAARAALEFIRTDAAPVSPVGADTPDGQPFWPAQVYVLLRDVPIDRTECVNACISIDRDANGGLVGVEVMGAIGVDVNGAAVSASGEGER